MKVLIAFASFMSLLAIPPVRAASANSISYEFVSGQRSFQSTLPNGLTVVISPNPLAPQASVIHWVKAGSLHETKGSTGIAHLFEHMMFRPLKGSKQNFFAKVLPLGAMVNANTRFGATVYETVVPQENLVELLKIESQRFKQTLVTDELLKIEREAVRSEYAFKIDAMPPMDKWLSLFTAAYRNHPFAWNIVGDRADLDKITAKDCNEFFAKFYHAGNIGLFISGNFDRDLIEKAVQAAYGDLPAGEPAKLPAPFSEKTEYQRVQGKLANASNEILLGYRLPYPHPDINEKAIFALYLLATGQRNLLTQRLVYQEKLASAIGSFNTDYDWGMLEFSIDLTDPAKIDQIATSIAKIPDDVLQMPEADYQAYLQNFRIEGAESLLVNQSYNSILAMSWGKFGDLQLLPSLAQKPLQLNRKDLAEWLRSVLAPSNATLVEGKKSGGISK